MGMPTEFQEVIIYTKDLRSFVLDIIHRRKKLYGNVWMNSIADLDIHSAKKNVCLKLTEYLTEQRYIKGINQLNQTTQ